MYESQPEVYIAYNFVIKECRVVVILSGEFIFLHLSYVSNVESKSLWPQIKIWLRDGSILTGCLMTQDMGLLSTGGVVG